MLSGSLQLKSPGLKCPPTFKTIALNSSTEKGPATWTHLTSIIIVFSSSFTTNFANFWIRLQYFNFLIIITRKRKFFHSYKHTKNNHLKEFICLSGQNSAHIPEEFCCAIQVPKNLARILWFIKPGKSQLLFRLFSKQNSDEKNSWLCLMVHFIIQDHLNSVCFLAHLSLVHLRHFF